MKVKFNLDYSDIRAVNLRPFYAGLVAGMVMAMLSYFGISPFKNSVIAPKSNKAIIKVMNSAPAQESIANSQLFH